MPIVDITENLRLPVIGKIRLGIRKTSQKGAEYPSETPHFVLKDAPELVKVYGEEPTEIEAYFPADDPEKVIPHYYKWYAGGMKDSNGEVIGGKLQCYGDGRTAHFLAKRDPVTRVVPTRECKGTQCPDWTKNGFQQCKPSMSVYLIIPRVSLLGVYQVDTTSWNAIRSFVSQVTMIHKAWGRLTNIPFKIYREPTQTTFVDQNGKEQRRVHHIMRIKPFEEFPQLYGEEIQQKVAALQPKWQPDPQQLIEAPMEDNFAVTHEQVSDGRMLTTQEAKVDRMTAIAEDKELQPMFTQLCEMKRVENTAKIRLLTARKFENETDPKAALKAYLESQLAPPQQESIKEEPPKKAATPPNPPKEAATPPPPQDSDGLI